MVPPSVHITGLAAASALGETPDAQLSAMASGHSGLRPLSEFLDSARNHALFPNLPAGWLPNRAWFKGRRYGAASNAAVRAARLAVADAGWTPEQTASAWIFGGSSRANIGELLGAWPSRRPIAKFRASNSLHSEVAAAVSIELGIHGPWQMLANGCSAGLDALGLAWMALRSGSTQRALILGVELPLCSTLLEGFADTGLLATPPFLNDPFHPNTSGFFPGESVAALALEVGPDLAGPEIVWYGANSDAYDSIALPPDGAALARLLTQARANVPGAIVAVCPHSNGTPSNRLAETAALQSAFPGQGQPLTAHLMKPATGHSLGASGALETALLAAAMRQGHLPANLANLTSSSLNIETPTLPVPIAPGSVVLNIAIGMGGHNAVLALRHCKPA
jgi:3-oxoacyl-[acyl-carrier-protein] synthase II